MATQENSDKEIEKLKSQVHYEQIRAKNLADRAESEAKHQKDKSTEVLAIVSVLLLCAVAIILGLTGIIK